MKPRSLPFPVNRLIVIYFNLMKKQKRICNFYTYNTDTTIFL